MAVIRATILGCGSSGGVPRPNGDWGACDPGNPKNFRRRCSLLVERSENETELRKGDKVTRILVDTAPDFREQMLSAGVKRLDGVLITHDHADQTHGLDDLRVYVLAQRMRMPVWMNPQASKSLHARFGYAFEAPAGSPYPAILDGKPLPPPGEMLKIDGEGGPIEVVNFDQEHGRILSSGFRFGPIAYSPDVSAVPDQSYAILKGVNTWIVDALRDTPHSTHFTVNEALAALTRAGAKRGILTNLHIDLDYQALGDRLPDHVEPAYDGLQITLDVQSERET